MKTDFCQIYIEMSCSHLNASSSSALQSWLCTAHIQFKSLRRIYLTNIYTDHMNESPPTTHLKESLIHLLFQPVQYIQQGFFWVQELFNMLPFYVNVAQS